MKPVYQRRFVPQSNDMRFAILFLSAAVTVLSPVSPVHADSTDIAQGVLPAPAASAAVPAEETSAGSLSPQELKQRQDALIKASQNPVGNLGILPVLSSFNYGYGPYSHLQVNVNVQPVVPIQLSPDLNLISRTIIPMVSNPSSAPPTLCASAGGCPGTFGIGELTQQNFFAPKVGANGLIWGAGVQMLFPTASQV